MVALIKRLGLENSVAIRGKLDRNHAPEVIAKAKMLVIPSLEEALGLVAIEALATGIPVIASNVGGLPEIVSNEIGMLVEPGNHIELANAIQKVNRIERSNDNVNMRREAVKKFDTHHLGKELQTLYRQQWNQKSR